MLSPRQPNPNPMLPPPPHGKKWVMVRWNAMAVSVVGRSSIRWRGGCLACQTPVDQDSRSLVAIVRANIVLKQKLGIAREAIALKHKLSSLTLSSKKTEEEGLAGSPC